MSGNGVKEGAAIVSELPKEKLLTEQKVTNNKSSVEENVSGCKDDDKENVSGDEDDDKENVSGDEDDDKENVSGDEGVDKENVSGDEDDDKENVSGDEDDDKENVSGDEGVIDFDFHLYSEKFVYDPDGEYHAETFEAAFVPYKDMLVVIGGLGVPSALQKEGWRLLMSGADLVCVAPSGAERTRVFLLPALIHLEWWPKCGSCKSQCRGYAIGPTVLILTSTRESALTIQREMARCNYRGISSAVYPCSDVRGADELAPTASCHPQIIIGTRQGVADMLKSRDDDYLDGVTYIVLDEAQSPGYLINQLSSPRQTVVTTAAWGEEAQEIALHHMQHPAMVNERGDLECPLAMIGGEPCTIEHGAHSLDHRDREDA